jgi:hypothetical protein
VDLARPGLPFYGVNNHENLAGTDLIGPYNRIRMDNYGGWFTYEHPLWQLHRPEPRPVGTLRQYSGVFYYVDVVRGYERQPLVERDPQRTGVDRRGMAPRRADLGQPRQRLEPARGQPDRPDLRRAGPYTGSTSGLGPGPRDGPPLLVARLQPAWCCSRTA